MPFCQRSILQKEIIQKWNNERAEKTGKLFLIQQESAATTPDLYIIIIDIYVDTVKVEKIIAKGKPIVFFFSKYHDPCNSMQVEIDKIKEFEKSMIVKYCCIDYNAAHELYKTLVSMLDKFNEKNS